MSVEQTVVMEMGLYSDELRPRIELTDDASYLRFLIRQQVEMSQMYEKKLVLKQNQIDALENRKDTVAVENQWKERYEIMEKRSEAMEKQNEEHLKSMEKHFKDRYELMEKRVEIHVAFQEEYKNEISDLKYKLNEMRIDRDEYKYSLDNRDQEVLRLTAKLSDKQI
jgi:hypothetical protein